MASLSVPQKNVWNLQKFYEDTSITNICGSVIFRQKLNVEYLLQAIQKMVELQSGMRLHFSEKNGEPTQKVEPFQPFHIPVMTFFNMTELEKYASNCAKIPFPIECYPMFRILVFEMDGNTGILFCASHLIVDAWTINLIATQTYRIYQHIIAGNVLEEQTYDYLQKVESEQIYRNSFRYEQDRQYWTEKYMHRPDMSPIKMHTKSVTSAKAARYTTQLTCEMTAEMQYFCENNNITLSVLFESAVAIYLSKINPDNSCITWGTLVLNRAGRREKSTAGMFVTTMPLTVDISKNDRVLVLCNKIAIEHKKLFRHEKYPYSEIVQNLREQSNFSGNLYDVIISYQDSKLDLPACSQWYSNGYCEVPLEFHVDHRDDDSQFTITMDYQTELFDKKEIRLICNRILFLLRQITKHCNAKISELSILPEQEWQKVIHEFNDTAAVYPKNKCVHELFTSQVEKRPDNIALVFQERRFTYRELDEMSNALAHALRNKGVGPNWIVPIISKRSWHVIVAMLSVLKAGGAYMLVDPAYPIERIQHMFHLAKVKIALEYNYNNQLSVEAIDLGSFDYATKTVLITNCNKPEDWCYIIFTSGSTGKPKGVVISHRNVANFCTLSPNNRVLQELHHKQCRRFASVTNIIFDIFVTESLQVLVNGLTIYLANDEEVFSQRKLATMIRREKVEVIQTTPTKMRSYIADKNNIGYLKTVKAIILGGETLPKDLYLTLTAYTNAEIYNIYGPAETTVWSTNKAVKTAESITIGKPIANTEVYILDKNHCPQPIGVAGELCISGDGVGKGYLNQPELTSQKFLPDPFLAGNTMYCTGDLARWRTDGEIEYLGRIDTQIKIRGQRVELSEIESVMSEFPGVGLAAATDKWDKNGRQYLVGYYTTNFNVDEKAFRQELAKKLPQYMVPNYFISLGEMPMTASGKIDHKNLPLPNFLLQTQAYVAPQTERENVLCDILKEILERERIGITDNFFELGGDSLAAIQYVARAHTRGIDFPLQCVFDYPTVQSLCKSLQNEPIESIKCDIKDCEKYQPLLEYNIIQKHFVPSKRSLGNVLLTGATGFLGAHILDRLMKEEKGIIYCLVRGGQAYFEERLHYYFGDVYKNELGRRIIVLTGDIIIRQLFMNMPDSVQTIIHAAATVKHYGAYADFYHINVQGTENVINYAKRIGAKLIHISTISVSGNSFADVFNLYRTDSEVDFTETNLFVGQPLENVYVRSKFEAERRVLDAALAGLNVKIVRVGNLTNRINDFRFQPNYQSNAFLMRFKAALELGCIPDYLLPMYVEFSPVEQTAEGILKIAQYADMQTVFHLNSNRPIYFDRLIEVLNGIGIHIDVLDGKTFDKMLQACAKRPDKKHIYEVFQNDLDKNGRLSYESNIHIKNDFTTWFLGLVGFEWIQIDNEYIKGYINYFRENGYL